MGRKVVIIRYFWLGLFSFLIWRADVNSPASPPIKFSSFCYRLRRVREISRESGYIKIGNIGLLVGHDKAEMSRAAVEEFVAKLKEGIEKQGRVVIAMPVGDTPVDFYKILTQQYKEMVDWSKVIVLQLAELVGVSGEEPTSGQYLLKRDFLEPLGIKQAYFLNGKAENLELEAQRFETLIDDKFFPFFIFNLIFSFEGIHGVDLVTLSFKEDYFLRRVKYPSRSDQTAEALRKSIGDNLVEKLKKNNPSAYKEVLSILSEVSNFPQLIEALKVGIA